MRIYIRHGPKEYANGHSENFKYDSPLKENVEGLIKEYSQYLVKTYGVPSLIICSPYLRTRQTAHLLNSALEEQVKIYCDPMLSEYLGNHADKELDVFPETLQFDPPHPETWKDLEKRAAEHYHIFSEYDTSDEVVWFVTHGCFITCLTKLIGKIYKKPPFLGAICIRTSSGPRVKKPSCLPVIKRFYTIVPQYRHSRPQR